MKSVVELLNGGARRGPVDIVLAATAIALLGFGVVMVYSASVGRGDGRVPRPAVLLEAPGDLRSGRARRSFLVSRIDYHRLRALTYPILGVVTVMMILSVIGFGHTGGGAARWLALGPIHIQPSEAAKLALILWLAYSLAKKQEKVKSFSIGMVPHFLMAGFLMALCLKQPDFGGASMLLLLTFTLLFVAGARLGYLLGAAMLGAVFAVWAVRFTDYRWERMLAWFNMAEHRGDLAYQPFQSVMSFGSGQFAGLGLGQGLQVLYLPEAHTDFISAIVGEELRLARHLVPVRRLPAHRVARRSHRARGRRRVRLVHRVRDLGAVRRASADQHVRRHGDVADQGPHAPLRELRRLLAPGERDRDGGLARYFAAHREPTQRAHVDGFGAASGSERHARDRGDLRAGGAAADQAPGRGGSGMSRTLIFAGGGTGGHVYPMLAIASEVKRMAPDVRLVFVGTSRGIEVNVVPAAGFELELLDVQPLRGGGVGQALRGAYHAAAALPLARFSYAGSRRRRCSVGGYASGPVALAAWSASVPVALVGPTAPSGSPTG